MGRTALRVSEAASAIGGGGVVVVPTETVYGLAATPDDRGVARMSAIKGRPPGKTFQLLLPDASWLEALGRPAPAARALAEAFWPGPLTLVVPAGPGAPPAVVSKGTVGLRVPAHPVALELLALTGPLAASSANRSGSPTPLRLAEIVPVFGDEVDGYLDGGGVSGEASTVVSLRSGEIEILRPGAVSEERLHAALGGRSGRA